MSHAHADEYLACEGAYKMRFSAVIRSWPILGATELLWTYDSYPPVHFKVTAQTDLTYSAVETQPKDPNFHMELEISRVDGKISMYNLIKGDLQSKISRDFCERRITEQQCGEQMQANGLNPFSCYTCLEWRGDYRISSTESFTCQRASQKF